MTIHFLKPALKAQDIHEFARRQQTRLRKINGQTLYPVWTSRRPARQNDLINNGSVYWIIKSQIQCRQPIVDIIEYREEQDEKPSYLIVCEPVLIRTQAAPKRPFQGWRYLDPAQAPADIGPINPDEKPPPPDLEKILKEAGLF